MPEALRFLSFIRQGIAGYGVETSDGIIDLSARHGRRWANLREALADEALEELSDAAARLSPDYPSEEITYAIPIPSPEKIICVGVNYPDRNEEYRDGQAAQSHPSLFVRFPRSFVGHGVALTRPPESEQLDYEGEIVLIIGRSGRRIPESEALSHVAGVSLANEGTIRDWVRHAKFNVTQGKNFDGTGSIGPWLTPFAGEDQVADIALETTVNGQLRQSDRTSRMIFPFQKIISYVSAFTTLVPGDVILTGTPTGAGARLDPPVWLRPGDVVEISATGLGLLRNTIQDEVAND